MKKIPRVLVASPIYELMDYCIDRFIAAMKSLDYDNYDIILVDNSRDQNFFDRLGKDKDLKVVQDGSDEKENLKRLINSRNKILDYAIENDYPYLLMMDCDVIPPSNTISELMEHDKDIISGLYFNHFPYDGKLVKLPGAWRLLEKDEFNKLKESNFISPKYKSASDVHMHLMQKDIDSRKPIKSTVPCAGCMLVKRKVFEETGYKIMFGPDGEKRTDDSHFLLEAKKKGFSIYCHTGIRCDHLVSGKYKKGKDGTYSHPVWDKE